MTTLQEEVERLLPKFAKSDKMNDWVNLYVDQHRPAVLSALQSHDDKLQAAEAEIADLKAQLDKAARCVKKLNRERCEHERRKIWPT